MIKGESRLQRWTGHGTKEAEAAFPSINYKRSYFFLVLLSEDCTNFHYNVNLTGSLSWLSTIQARQDDHDKLITHYLVSAVFD